MPKTQKSTIDPNVRTKRDEDLTSDDAQEKILQIIRTGTPEEFEKSVLSMEKKIDLGKKDENGFTVAHHLARLGKLEHLKKLYNFPKFMDKDKTTTDNNWTVLHLLAKYYKQPIIEFIEFGANVSETEKKNFFDSFVDPEKIDGDEEKENKTTFDERMMEVDTNKQFASFLVGFPSLPTRNDERRKIDSMKQGMLSFGCNSLTFLTNEEKSEVNSKDSTGRTPLILSAIYKNYSLAYLLCQSPNTEHEVEDNLNKNALHYATETGYTPMVRLLSQFRYKSSLKNSSSGVVTPLIHLSLNGNLTAMCSYVLQTLDHLATSERKMWKDHQLSTNSDSPFQRACENGNFAIVKFLFLTMEYFKLEKPNFEYVDLKANNLIHFSVHAKNVKLVKYLIVKSREQRMKEMEHKRDAESAKIALENRANSDLKTPLHIAAEINAVSCVEILIRNGADPELLDNEGNTPLLTAAANKSTEVFQTLTNEGSIRDKLQIKSKSCLFLAVESQAVDIVEYIFSDTMKDYFRNIQTRTDINGNSPIHQAAKTNNLKITKILTDSGISINAKNDRDLTPLHVAAYNGCIDVARFLMDREELIHNASDEDGNSPLHLACVSENLQIVETLVQNSRTKIDMVNLAKESAFDIACKKGNFKIAKYMLDHGVNPNNTVRSDKRPPLLHAAINGHAEICGLLLDFGADPTVVSGQNYKDVAFGSNALEICIEKNNLSCVKVLLEDSKWMEMMKKRSVSGKNVESPMRKLIKNMPELALFVLDKCITKEKVDPEKDTRVIKYNYEFIDDTFTEFTGDKRDETFHEEFNIFHWLTQLLDRCRKKKANDADDHVSEAPARDEHHERDGNNEKRDDHDDCGSESTVSIHTEIASLIHEDPQKKDEIKHGHKKREKAHVKYPYIKDNNVLRDNHPLSIMVGKPIFNRIIFSPR
ncbi:hypothetical protein Ciccas_002503 [Cichlidogyrus casuarinus]|uniref:Uncharacterized protein n=1 Tax=Cichlidogyrus casuarinus TaxID=1844966 RepID=A0ABD2QK92_9PLAT